MRLFADKDRQERKTKSEQNMTRNPIFCQIQVKKTTSSFMSYCLFVCLQVCRMSLGFVEHKSNKILPW